MFKWTFLERENIIEFKTGLHLSLHGLDVQIMAITPLVSPMLAPRQAASHNTGREPLLFHGIKQHEGKSGCPPP